MNSAWLTASMMLRSIISISGLHRYVAWFSEQEAAEVSPVSNALRSTGKKLLEALQLFSGHETGLRTHVEIEVTSQVAGILALDPSVGSVGEAKTLISRFQEEAAKIGHACMVAYADLNRKAPSEGRALCFGTRFRNLLSAAAMRIRSWPQQT